MTSKQPPSLANLLKEEKLLFSKEIEELYDIEQTEVKSFIEKELSNDQYELKEILGELYITN